MTQFNNAAGVFSLSYAQGLWKPVCSLLSFHIALLARKTQIAGQILYSQDSYTFKPKESKWSKRLFLILKIIRKKYISILSIGTCN